MSDAEISKPVSYFRTAWQSALAASICLGLPEGLFLWLAILGHLRPSPFFQKFSLVFMQYPAGESIGVLLGALGWGVLLSRISRYHKWWLLVAASMLGIYLGRRLFWVFYIWINYDFSGMPVSLSLAIHLLGQILSVTFCAGFTHGFIVRNWKAPLAFALSTSVISVLAAALTILVLDRLGIRVGMGNFAMPKVAAISTMVAAIVGGTGLGVMFSRYVTEPKQTGVQA